MSSTEGLVEEKTADVRKLSGNWLHRKLVHTYIVSYCVVMNVTYLLHTAESFTIS